MSANRTVVFSDISIRFPMAVFALVDDEIQVTLSPTENSVRDK